MTRIRFASIVFGVTTLATLTIAATPALGQLAPDAASAPGKVPPSPLPPPATTAPDAPVASPPAAASPAEQKLPAGEPGYLGVVTDDRQDNNAGVRVTEVVTGAPAENGGLKADDLITSINGTAVHNEDDMVPLLEKLRPGSSVKFGIRRGVQQTTVDVTLGSRPPAGQRKYEKFGQLPQTLPEPNQDAGPNPGSSSNSGSSPSLLQGPLPSAPPGDLRSSAGGLPLPGPATPNAGQPVPPGAGPVPLEGNFGQEAAPQDRASQPHARGMLPPLLPSRRPLLGVRTRPITDEAAQRLHLPSTKGALVVSRTVGSPAAQAGIPLDAIITAVDGKPVAGPSDLTAFISQAGAGREVDITYFHDGTDHHAKVKLAESGIGAGNLFGGSSIGAGPTPSPPAPESSRLPTPDDKTRIDALERRVQQLEHRVDDLEESLRKSR